MSGENGEGADGSWTLWRVSSMGRRIAKCISLPNIKFSIISYIFPESYKKCITHIDIATTQVHG
jgi:hypothetical protein